MQYIARACLRNAFFTCYVGYCSGAGGEGESPSCIIANCSAEFTDLTEDCHACIGTSGVYISDILIRFVSVIFSFNGFCVNVCEPRYERASWLYKLSLSRSAVSVDNCFVFLGLLFLALLLLYVT